MLEWPDSKKLGIIRRDVFKQQQSLVCLAETYGLHSNELFKKQKILLNSLFFRIVAIDNLSKSDGSRISGIDGIKITNKRNPDLYLDLLKSIKHEAKNPYNYKTSPIKKAWVPKNKNSLKPLGIPILKDRALQHLVNLILEPLVEMTSEPHSFGFRPYRSAKQAIAHLRSNLKTRNLNVVKKRASKINSQNELFELLPENKVILDPDIKGFFDNLNHDWILNNLFLHPDLITLVKVWLKSDVVDKGIFSKNSLGIPRGGVISSALTNFTLNGLESTIMNSITPITKSKEKRIPILLKDGSRTRIASSLAYVRYADNFVVLARSKHLINDYVLPSVKKFLNTRGLAISKEKTKIFRLCDNNAQLNFLGYTFKYQDKWSLKSHVFYSRHAGSRGIALYPSKKKVFEVIQRIKFIFKVSKNLDAYNLIVKLNPVIRGWSNYFNMSNSSHYRDTVKNATYRLTWMWACRKHKRWGRKVIANKYFLRKILSTGDVRLKGGSYSKFKNRKWVFHGTVNKKSRYNAGKDKIIYLVDVSNISQLLASKCYILPKKYVSIHGYHPDYMKLATHQTNVIFKTGGKYSSFKERLLKKQNNFCSQCKELLVNSEGLYGYQNLHIHHLEPIYKGGSRNSVSNMVLLHSWCHYDIDHKDLGA
jgi:RNA-directed DNA polymerase